MPKRRKQGPALKKWMVFQPGHINPRPSRVLFYSNIRITGKKARREYTDMKKSVAVILLQNTGRVLSQQRPSRHVYTSFKRSRVVNEGACTAPKSDKSPSQHREHLHATPYSESIVFKSIKLNLIRALNFKSISIKVFKRVGLAVALYYTHWQPASIVPQQYARTQHRQTTIRTRRECRRWGSVWTRSRLIAQ